jgi:hypothetical protein
LGQGGIAGAMRVIADLQVDPVWLLYDVEHSVYLSLMVNPRVCGGMVVICMIN